MFTNIHTKKWMTIANLSGGLYNSFTEATNGKSKKIHVIVFVTMNSTTKTAMNTTISHRQKQGHPGLPLY
jgi:hypothetical protein